ncbi:hypothetical protein OG21DRAFT_1106534 [Imleria badia]|nr:hypothetical protein OG21DRAFT_1106534 [Imleria badia]
MGGTTFATSSRAAGTLRWVAPELLCLDVSSSEDVEDLPNILPTPRSDIYSFGGIMIQVLTGRIPYHYYSRDERVLFALSQGETPKRPVSVLVTDDQWYLTQWCWSTIDGGALRPTAEQVFSFVMQLRNHNHLGSG